MDHGEGGDPSSAGNPRNGADHLRRFPPWLRNPPLTERSSLDPVGAFGDSLDRSVFAARARGYTGIVDVEIVGGRRAQDLFGGVTSSAAVGDAEVHGEATVFRVPAGVDHDVVWKAIVGGSYRFPIGSGILAYAEYHYSGFGAARPEAIAALRTPSFLEHGQPPDGGLLRSEYGAAPLSGLLQLRLYF